jgi:hypothetical protein
MTPFLEVPIARKPAKRLARTQVGPKTAQKTAEQAHRPSVRHPAASIPGFFNASSPPSPQSLALSLPATIRPPTHRRQPYSAPYTHPKSRALFLDCLVVMPRWPSSANDPAVQPRPSPFFGTLNAVKARVMMPSRVLPEQPPPQPVR